MSMRAPLVTGTILSLAVTAAWAWMSALTVGPVGPMHLTWRHPAAAYVTVAAAPTGTSWGLFAVVAFIYAACLGVSDWRCSRRPDSRRER